MPWIAKIIIGTRPVRLAWNVFPIIRSFMSDGTVQKRMVTRGKLQDRMERGEDGDCAWLAKKVRKQVAEGETPREKTRSTGDI